jgi:hypothetical protein
MTAIMAAWVGHEDRKQTKFCRALERKLNISVGSEQKFNIENIVAV